MDAAIDLRQLFRGEEGAGREKAGAGGEVPLGVVALPQRGFVTDPFPSGGLRPIPSHAPGEDGAVELHQELETFAGSFGRQGRGLFQQGHVLPRAPGCLTDAVEDALFSGNLLREAPKIPTVVDPAQRRSLILHINITGFSRAHGEFLAPELDAEFLQIIRAYFCGRRHLINLFSSQNMLAPFLPGSHGLLGI